MTDVRQRILTFLKEHGQATVIELAQTLELAPVSVRHHLEILLNQGLIRLDGVLRRPSRGRPRHIYVLTPEANAYFPNSYEDLARRLLAEMKKHLPEEQVSDFFHRLAAEAVADDAGEASEGTESRLKHATEVLSDLGYLARWEKLDGASQLHVYNCPYKGLPEEHTELCDLSLEMVSNLLQKTPRRIAHVLAGDHTCSYVVE